MAMYRCGSVSPTPITPSDSSPAALTSGTVYEPTASGYAIESSPTSVTPSDASPVTLTSGDVIKLSGNGKAVASVTNLTPSDSSPANIFSGEIYKATTNGVAVGSVETITPSDSSPYQIGQGYVYTPTTGGYAIETMPYGETPSDTNPPSVSNGDIVKMGGAGYLYATQEGSSETTLWTNSSPTSNFNSQSVSLSDDYTNYKKIRFYYRVSTSDDTETYIEYDKAVIDTWLVQGSTASGYKNVGTITFQNGSYTYTRPIRRGSSGDNSFYIYVAYRLNTQANLQTHGIPTKITGLQH